MVTAVRSGVICQPLQVLRLIVPTAAPGVECLELGASTEGHDDDGNRRLLGYARNLACRAAQLLGSLPLVTAVQSPEPGLWLVWVSVDAFTGGAEDAVDAVNAARQVARAAERSLHAQLGLAVTAQLSGSDPEPVQVGCLCEPAGRHDPLGVALPTAKHRDASLQREASLASAEWRWERTTPGDEEGEARQDAPSTCPDVGTEFGRGVVVEAAR